MMQNVLKNMTVLNMDKIRLARTLQTDSIVDGKGLRCVLWTQGCLHNCLGCHNPNTHALDGGEEFSIDEVISWIERYPYHDGITLSGGEPFLQPDALVKVLDGIEHLHYNVWCYTGFVFEQLVEDASKRKLLEKIDVLVDGPFVLSKRSLAISFRGSTNQRLIDVKASLKENRVIELK